MMPPLGSEDRVLLDHGVEHPAIVAYAALMSARVSELTDKLLTETDDGELHRLQGAARELSRWARYPQELEDRVRGWEEGA